MKHFLIVVLLSFLFCATKAQDKPVLENDTLSYAGKKYWINQEVKIGYGSGSNKDFVFVFIGSGLAGVTPLEANWAKSSFKIDKVYKQRGKYFVRGKAVDAGPLLGSKIFVDLELAIDSKEL